jgi:osmotically-inducible protein OsmY
MKNSKRICMMSLVAALAVPGLSTADENQAGEYPADNSGKNVRDRDAGSLTPSDQYKGSDADVKTTQMIRKAVVADDSLSMSAQNVKIITLDGVVTLRGPVASPAEKAKVEQIAMQHAGPNKVTNQIEVAP